MGALVAPGAMIPVSQRALFSVAVCSVVSAFCQDTVCPTAIVAAAGEYDIPPASPLMVITTSAVGAGVAVAVGGGGGGVVVPPPQATAQKVPATIQPCMD